RRYIPLTGSYGANDFQQFVFRGALQHISSGARSQGALNFYVAARCGQHDHARLWILVADGNQSLRSARPRQPVVHQNQIGAKSAIFLQSLVCRGSLGNNGHVGLRSEDQSQPFAEHRMVLDGHDSYLFGCSHFTYAVILPTVDEFTRSQSSGTSRSSYPVEQFRPHSRVSAKGRLAAYL